MVSPTKNVHYTRFCFRDYKRKTEAGCSASVIECGGITDYRTFMNDFRKCAEFVRWLKEKTEG